MEYMWAAGQVQGDVVISYKIRRKSGSFGMWHHPRGYVSTSLVRLASTLKEVEE